MKFLITGPLNGNTKRMLGLIEVSEPDITISIGPLKLKEPLQIKGNWFFVRGEGDDLEVLSKSSGIDILSRVFKTKEGITFSGLSGVYHPQTVKFTRREWIKAHGKIEKRKRNYLFKDDIEGLLIPFKKSGLKSLDLLILADVPERPPIKRLIQEVKPKYLFYPSTTFKKEKVGSTLFVGLEEISSPKGKYLLTL